LLPARTIAAGYSQHIVIVFFIHDKKLALAKREHEASAITIIRVE
jgi:hypothetical protein